MIEFPPTDDPLVWALQQLLAREGGHVAVADEAGINDQSLYQIATLKVDSKTGKPKGVGPSIRKRLDKRYPGWMGPPLPDQVQTYLSRDRDASEPMSNDQVRFSTKQAVEAQEPSAGESFAIASALERIGMALAGVPLDTREALAINLAGWARDGGRGPWQTVIRTLLTHPSKARRQA